MNSATIELFEQVKAIVSGRQASEAEMRDLAQRVGEAGGVFQRRVDRAIRYARAGLRLEAAAEAEAEPSLFALAEALDTRHCHEWRAICERERWTAPPTPDPGALAELNEAIAELRPLRRLMARMRFMVLSDAEPWERMLLLRQLAAHDPHNPIWRDDLEALEPHCAQRLAEEADAAMTAGDLARAERCMARLERGEWEHAAVGRSLAVLGARLDAAIVAECAARAGTAIEALEAEWSAASPSGVERRLGEWDALLERATTHGGTLPPALEARAEAVRNWLDARRNDDDAHRRHVAAAAALEEVLARASPGVEALRAALAASETTSEGCPQPLRARALDELGRLERRAAARRTMAIVGAVTAVAAVVAGIWWGVQRAVVAGRAEAMAAAIRAHVSAGNLDAAATALGEAGQDAAVADDARVATARREYMAARAALALGDQEFDAAIAAAGDPGDAGADLAAFERAQRLARTDAQRTAVEEWRRLQQRASTARDSARAQDQLKVVRALAQEIAAARPAGEDAVALAALADLEARLSSVARDAGGNPAVLREVEAARALLEAHRAAQRDEAAARARERALLALAQAATDPEALHLAIEGFMRENPGTPEATALREAAAAAPAWSAVERWNPVAARGGLATAATAPQDERDALHAALQAYAAAAPESPLAPGARALAALVAPAQGWRTWLEDKMGQLPAFRLYSVELRDGTRLYMTQDPVTVSTQTDPAGGAYRVYPVLLAEGTAPRTGFQRVEVASVKTQGPAPQRALVPVIRRAIEGDGPSAPNDMQAALAVLALLRDTDAVDGAFAAQVVRGMLESLEPEAPRAFQESVRSAARRLARERPEEINWLSPSPAERERSKALRALLRQQIRVEEWRKAYAEAVAAAAGPLDARFEPVGVLLASPAGAAGAPRAAGASADTVLRWPEGRAPRGPADLVALRVGVGATPAALVSVGRVDAAGVVTLNPAIAPWPMGTLVWARRPGGGQ
jgi:hypothetical protein